MWRRNGAGFNVFGVITGLTFALISIGLITLFVSFIQPSGRAGIRALISITLLTGAAAFLLLTFQFAYHLSTLGSARGTKLERARLDSWLACANGEGPKPPLDPASASALAQLREATVGNYSDQFAQLYREHGFLQADIVSLSSRQRSHRSMALSRLAQMRDPEAIPALQGLLVSGPKNLATDAFRALARSLDSESVPLKRAKLEFVAGCKARGFSVGEVESALVLTGRHSAGLVRHLLATHRYPIAALAVVGHRNLLELVPLLHHYIKAEDPEIRAAALKAVAKIEQAPPGSEELVLANLAAKQSFVRAQAAKAAIAVPLEDAEGPLVKALGDEDWWVRRNAAACLMAFGPSGREVLSKVALGHTDRFARESAKRAIQ